MCTQAPAPAICPGSASETLDLRCGETMKVNTTVIPNDNAPQMKLRPDDIGRQAFEEGFEAYLRSKYCFARPRPKCPPQTIGMWENLAKEFFAKRIFSKL